MRYARSSALQKAGVKFVAADMPEANEMVVGIMALVAQAERRMISERTKAALAVAKARGVKLGSPLGATSLQARPRQRPGPEALKLRRRRPETSQSGCGPCSPPSTLCRRERQRWRWTAGASRPRAAECGRPVRLLPSAIGFVEVRHEARLLRRLWINLRN